MKVSTKFAVFALSVLVTVPAQARNFEYYLETNPLPGGQEFEVLNRPGTGPTLFWCGAGTHAFRQLGLGHNDRIYLVQGRAPSVTQPGWSAVTFTVDPNHPVVGTYQDQSWSVSIKDPGFSLSVDSARQFCFEKMS